MAWFHDAHVVNEPQKPATPPAASHTARNKHVGMNKQQRSQHAGSNSSSVGSPETRAHTDTQADVQPRQPAAQTVGA
jgi:hypothetical protein